MNLAKLLIPGLGLFLLLQACSKTDSVGREIGQDEEFAIRKCNDLLDSDFRGTLGKIDLSSSVIRIDEKDLAHISWNAKTSRGSGAMLCSFDLARGKVVQFIVDGVEVNLNK